MENIGILIALSAAIAWGMYPVPLKISKTKNLIQFQALIGVGVFLSALIISLILGYSLSLNAYGLASGMLWAIANCIFLSALLNLGISKAVPITSSLVVVSSFLWGVMVFKEIPSGALLGVLGVGAIVAGVILISATSPSKSQNIKKGLLAAVLSGIIFGSQLAPLKIGQVVTRDFFFSMSLGIFLTSAIIFLIKRSKLQNEAVGFAFLSGAIWNIGNLLSLVAISMVGLAKAIPITQSSTLIAVLWGLFYFKEIKQRRYQIQILLGAIVLLSGVMILSQA